ncbi:unnamed protein product, partial [Chilo suppressalis]
CCARIGCALRGQPARRRTKRAKVKVQCNCAVIVRDVTVEWMASEDACTPRAEVAPLSAGGGASGVGNGSGGGGGSGGGSGGGEQRGERGCACAGWPPRRQPAPHEILRPKPRRPSSGCRPSDEGAWCGGAGAGAAGAGAGGARALRVRVSGTGAAPGPAHARRLSPPPHAHRATTPPAPLSPNAKPNTEETPASGESGGVQLKAVSAVSPLTAASAPVRGAPAQSSHALKPKHEHVHRPVENQPVPVQNGVRECNSSSDENRSSGHASMSDSGGGGEAGREEPRRARQPPHNRTKHRPHNKLQSPWPGGGGLEDIRSAIKQLTLRSRDSSSTATSGGSNNGATETGSAAEARRRRAPLVRQPSLDTVCTNVTSADEFVWVDSHNRLVELRCVPWTGGEVSRALQVGRCKEVAHKMAPDAPPRLAYLLQRALVRISREAQRLSQNFGFCSKHEVVGAFKIVLSTPLADACIKGCQRAATMYATGGAAARRLGSAARARTSLAPGRFQRWMLDVRVAPFVHEYAAIYLCAGMETLLEEIALIAGSNAGSGPITPAAIDHAVATCADLWGLLQPYSHLNAGRIASGALSLSRWESMSSLGSGSSSGVARPENRQLGLSHDSGITTNGSGGSGGSGTSAGSGGSGAASVLLTTCAGSAAELRAVLRRLSPRAPPLSPAAERALYYFMRCSQLEHSSGASGGSCGAPASSGGGLWGERGAGALPPLGEWVRAVRAHASLRPPPAAPDADDVLQAARLLLPHADCPPRPVTVEEAIEPWWSRSQRSSEEVGRAALSVAQRALLGGRPELLGGVRALLPPAPLDAPDPAGLTALMKAALAGDDHIVAMLLESGADPNIECGGACGAHCALPLSPRSPPAAQPAYTPPTAGWTALVFACAGAGSGGGGALECARRLLAGGARVDGAPARGDDVCTLTPLQIACGVGNLELVQLLLSHGADPFLSTQLNDALCYSAAAQYGCYSAVGVCCTHGRRACLRAVVRGGSSRGAGGAGGAGAVLSLEEVLAEGAPPAPRAPYTKLQQRALQDAMYCSAETDHLDITLELRALGVPWSLHAWTLSLAAAADAALDHVIDQLLQDFLQVCPSDDSHYSKQFIYECLPLLFNILRYSKKEGTVLLLADILCACYGWERVPPVLEPPPAHQPPPARVDPSYVNNPELADVTFRVEGRLFYGHKIVLVSESPRLRAMLTPPRQSNEGLPNANTAPPLVQINDIRYHIFEQVMKYLYSGGCSNLDIPESDVLEVLAAAAFFQLLPLQRHCEARAATTVDLHNLVSVYIHAKVYGATQLLEYCQGFLLQNMVALLTYDDSVKRLLFGKRLPGHNVLGALLATLQKRIETRKTQAKSR